MKSLAPNFDTLVVLGAWNKHIFSEKWIQENILEKEWQYSVLYPMNTIGSLKFSLKNIDFFIMGERLVFQIKNTDETTYQEIVKIARKIFQKLIHTPVSAIGINFLLKSTHTESQLPDNEKLIQTIGKDITTSEITRSFALSSQETLNLKIEFQSECSMLNFNFNYQIESIQEILNILGDNDDLIVEKLTFAKKIRNDYSA